MQLLYVKNSTGNLIADELLTSPKSPLGIPCIVLYFGKITAEALNEEDISELLKNNKTDFKDFKSKNIQQITDLKKAMSNNTVWCLTKTDSQLHIYQLTGSIFQIINNVEKRQMWDDWVKNIILKKRGGDGTEKKKKKINSLFDEYIHTKDRFPKFIEIINISSISTIFAPEIIATLSSSQEFAHKTFKLIESVSIKNAICQTFSHLSEFYTPVHGAEMLKFLGPIEFETLIFKIFDSLDLFVSGTRGGTRKAIDLIITNPHVNLVEIKGDTKEKIQNCIFSIEPNGQRAIQVKHKENVDLSKLITKWDKTGKKVAEKVDLVVALSFNDEKQGEKWTGQKWDYKMIWRILQDEKLVKIISWAEFMVKTQYEYWLRSI